MPSPTENFASEAISSSGETEENALHSPNAESESGAVGFLLVGHGTRRVAGQDQLRSVFADFAPQLAPHPAALGFLELADPDIPTAVAELARRGVQRLVTVPVLLFSAGHAEHDIPEAVAEAAKHWGIRSVTQVPPLECCQPILDLSARRFREAVCGPKCFPVAASTCDDGAAENANASADGSSENVAENAGGCSSSGSGSSSGFCSGNYCPKVAMVMLGRGSSSPTATAEMRRFTELRMEMTRVAWGQTGFIHAQSPNVTEALDELAASELPVAVVQPHLLFEGELIDNLRKEVAERQKQQPDRRWIITETLGTDASLARTLAQVALALSADGN